LFQLSKSAPVEPAIIILATDEHGKTQIKKEEFGNLSENEKENILLMKICVNPWQKKSK